MAEPGFEPGAAGWEARMLPLFFAAPSYVASLDDIFRSELKPKKKKQTFKAAFFSEPEILINLPC